MAIMRWWAVCSRFTTERLSFQSLPGLRVYDPFTLMIWDEMRWNEMGWDVLGCVVMGRCVGTSLPGKMRWDEMRCDEMCVYDQFTLHRAGVDVTCIHYASATDARTLTLRINRRTDGRTDRETVANRHNEKRWLWCMATVLCNCQPRIFKNCPCKLPVWDWE